MLAPREVCAIIFDRKHCFEVILVETNALNNVLSKWGLIETITIQGSKYRKTTDVG